MKLDDAKMILIKNNVPSYIYTLSGLGNGDCVGIEYHENKWITYFSEKGNKINIIVHNHEDDACRHFLSKVSENYDSYVGIKINLI
jgi:hypothetical protein